MGSAGPSVQGPDPAGGCALADSCARLGSLPAIQQPGRPQVSSNGQEARGGEAAKEENTENRRDFSVYQKEQGAYFYLCRGMRRPGVTQPHVDNHVWTSVCRYPHLTIETKGGGTSAPSSVVDLRPARARKNRAARAASLFVEGVAAPRSRPGSLDKDRREGEQAYAIPPRTETIPRQRHIIHRPIRPDHPREMRDER